MPAIAAQFFEACYAEKGQQLLRIENLGTSCGYSFAAFVGAFFYGILAVRPLLPAH